MEAGVDCIGISTSFYCCDGKGRWLFHKRSDTCRDEKGTWDTGGGKLEFGLSLEENVRKEVREEYGCNGIIQQQLPPITLFRKSPSGAKTHWIVIPFIVLIEDSEREKVRIGDIDKIVEIGWFSLNELPQPLHTGFQKTKLANEEIFKKYSFIE